NLAEVGLGEIVVERCPILDDQRGLIEWRQPGPYSGMAAFLIAGKLKFTWFYFAGRDPAADAGAVRASEELINSLASDLGLKNSEVKLNLLAGRPLAVCVPWTPSPSEQERRIVGNYAVCLGLAFFEKVSEVLNRGKALLGQSQQGWPGWGFQCSDN